MYAVIETGGKQHRVTVGQQLEIEKLDAEAGASVSFDKVLLVGEGGTITIGQPYVKAAKVNAEVLEHNRGEKVTIIKFKRRKHHLKHQGHRQHFTKIKVVEIES